MVDSIQRVLIVGGTGMIGGRLAQRLIETGRQVWVLSRHPRTAGGSPDAEQIAWDGRTSEGWLHLIDQVDAVIQLAGANLGAAPWTDVRRREIVASRVESGQAVSGAFRAATARPKVLIQASAIGYYGTSETATFSEADPPGDDWLSSVCLAWENATRDVEELGVRRVIVRTGLVLERHVGILSQMALPFRLWVGGKIGSGRQWMSWIHIEDELRAILFLLENNGARGAYNLTAPNPVTNAEFATRLGEALNRPDWFPTPALAVRLALGKMSYLALYGQKVLPERLIAAGFEFRYTELSKALGDIYKKNKN